MCLQTCLCFVKEKDFVETNHLTLFFRVVEKKKIFGKLLYAYTTYYYVRVEMVCLDLFFPGGRKTASQWHTRR